MFIHLRLRCGGSHINPSPFPEEPCSEAHTQYLSHRSLRIRIALAATAHAANVMKNQYKRKGAHSTKALKHSIENDRLGIVRFFPRHCDVEG